MKLNEIKYHGAVITYNLYKNGKFTVDFEGDDLVFDTLENAKNFIDDMEIYYR